MYNYLEDPIALACLEEAKKVKSNIGFGAVLVKYGEIIGRGRNRRSTNEDRIRLTHVDYAIHAEQDAILDAINSGFNVNHTEVYVIGIVLSGKNKDALSVRTKKEFGCRKCPHTLVRFNISVNIPHVDGWAKLSPQEAMKTGTMFHGNGIWLKFAEGLICL